MLHVMRRLNKLDEKDLGELIDKLDAIRTRLFRGGAIRFVVTCEDQMIETLQPLLANLVDALPPGAPSGPAEKPEPLKHEPEARTAPVPVAFNVRIFKTVRTLNATGTGAVLASGSCFRGSGFSAGPLGAPGGRASTRLARRGCSVSIIWSSQVTTQRRAPPRNKPVLLASRLSVSSARSFSSV